MKMQLLVFFIFSSFISTYAGVFECTDNSDCAVKCQNNVCICPPRQTLNLKGTKCLDVVFGLEESCEDDNQCGFLGGSYKCDPKIGKCVCSSGWVYLKGSCIKRIQTGGQCEEHDDCFDGVNYKARICKDKKCSCNDGYYDRQGYDCRKLRNLGESCLIDSDCKKSVCSFGTCTIDPADQCENSESCKGKNMYCSPFFRTCLCNRGYFLNGTDCHAELGTNCDDEICQGFGKNCIDGICLCMDEYFQKPANRECTQGPFKPFFDCVDDTSCAIFGDHSQCRDIGSEKKCDCLDGYKLNDNFLCEPSDADCTATVELGSICKTDYDCKNIENAICNDGDKCGCAQNFVEIGKTECLKGVDVTRNDI